MKFVVTSVLSALGLVACSAVEAPSDWRDVSVQPNQFALLPCDGISERPCTLIVAGGKRILFGAPAGVGRALRADDLRQLDAVVLPSLMAGDLEGLDEVRNASWHQGRARPLLVIGPAGISDVVSSLNKAFEFADALYTVESGDPAGGFDAAILTDRLATVDRTVFSTGDLEVRSMAYGYLIYYVKGRTAQLAGCNWFEATKAELDPSDHSVTIGCAGSNATYQWPITEPIFVEN